MQRGTIRSRLQHAWNAFLNRDPTYRNAGTSSMSRPDRVRLSICNEKSIIAPIYNRIATHVAGVSIKHVRLDQNERYLETIKSSLNEALTLEANLDQTGRALIQDAIMSMFDEGCIAIVPTDTTVDPSTTSAFEVETLRVGKILEWYPQHVRLRVYNERTGKREEITMHKREVAIVENPFYAVMNEANSTLKRLIRKLNLLDSIDEQSGSGKLDIIIQLPYVIKTPQRKQQAEERRKDIEEQLSGSKYGIAYTDGTERVTQLNRPAENNLMAQIEYLTSMLYSQLGMTVNIFNGTADEEEMLNFFYHTIEPCLSAIVDEMKRKFLSKTARTQNQSVMFFRDPFKLVPVTALAEIADSFTRNAILSSNDVRAVIGYKPSEEPHADQLSNKNLNAPEGAPGGGNVSQGDPMNDILDGLEAEVDSLLGGDDNEES